jgi:hypothetical protein
MSDLDILREALREETGEGSLDVQVILIKGRQLRRRRRLTVAGGALCLAGVGLGAVIGIGHLTGSPSVPAGRPVSPASSVHQPAPRHQPTPPSGREPSPAPSSEPTSTPSSSEVASPSAISPRSATTLPAASGVQSATGSASPPVSSPAATAGR